MRRRSGFTLIELLVVIAIIAILAAILFPVFARAKEAAGKSACLNNLKQLGTAQLLYRDAYNDRMPLHISWAGSLGGGGQGDFSSYYILLSKYTKTRNGSFVCPQTYTKELPKAANGTVISGPGKYACRAMSIGMCPGNTADQKAKWLKERYGYNCDGNYLQTTSYAALLYPGNPTAPRTEWASQIFPGSVYRQQSKIVYLFEAVYDFVISVDQFRFSEDEGGYLAPRHDGGKGVALLYYDGHCKVETKKFISDNAETLLSYKEKL